MTIEVWPSNHVKFANIINIFCHVSLVSFFILIGEGRNESVKYVYLIVYYIIADMYRNRITLGQATEQMENDK